MEKLIELLYEYNKIAENKLGLITSVKELGQEIWFDKKKEVMRYECEIISKSYGFIKWLVENDKIDFSREGEYCTKSIEEFDGLLRDDEDGLIMILSISDTPIEDLCKYLK